MTTRTNDLFTVLKSILRVVTAPMRRRRVYEELMALDDRMLADIGITRNDIPRIASGHATVDSGNNGIIWVAVSSRRPIAA